MSRYVSVDETMKDANERHDTSMFYLVHRSWVCEWGGVAYGERSVVRIGQSTGRPTVKTCALRQTLWPLWHWTDWIGLDYTHIKLRIQSSIEPMSSTHLINRLGDTRTGSNQGSDEKWLHLSDDDWYERQINVWYGTPLCSNERGSTIGLT